jgi:hypothetical protein
VLSTSATVKNSTLSRAYTERFGGRATSGYMSYLIDVARDYAHELAVWTSLSTRSLATGSFGAPSMVARVSALVLFGLAITGWGAAGRRWLVARRSSNRRSATSPEAWSMGVVAVVILVKAAMDIASAPLWASAWYSAPQRLAIGFAVGAGAWLGVRVVAARSHLFAGVAIIGVAFLALPINAAAWSDQVRATHEASRWQDQIDLAADWIAESGPPGRYGARDAGLLGFRLDSTTAVVNLDGLVNDYDFAELVSRNAPLLERIQYTKVEYFVGRLRDDLLADLTPCAQVVWTSPGMIPYSDSLHGYSEAPIRIVDTRACLT